MTASTIRFNEILVGVDDRGPSRDAAVLGEALAQATRADLLLVAAYPDPLLPFPLTVTSDVHRKEDARRLLAAIRPALAPSAHTVAVPDYSSARALRRTARDRRADLLVLGSSRSAKPGHAAAGRTGRQVLHDAPCAVALAAAGLHERPAPLRRIVVGVDMTPESRLALACAETIAGTAGATVTAVAVADDRLPVDSMPLGMVGELGTWDEVVELHRGHLAEHLDALLTGQEAVAREVRVGDPVEELTLAAAGADLLVIGSRRWGAVDRIAIGSTAEALAQGAPCSLLVVPRPEAPAGAASEHATATTTPATS